ncbi:alkyl hydroperoxide reductase, F subunit [Aedoeadaptatus nemausensis]|uniref:Alkyl hydroperoxide reductase, F subunit n=1 Tax=Aedoeadaptatus nemausensis TaxID=2582829 RepID=A0A6V6Y423_9FIRM|nr:alkyl hydroperoxide reductase subunit F [Peptoniphilus nemausensis]CAC9931315.1 alkyl hydroperoxide reductase, F subunit [Peptoniphilus nemausensis]
MLDQGLKNQLKQYLQLLEGEVVFTMSLDDSENSKKLSGFVEEIVGLSPRLHVEKKELELTPSFSLSSGDRGGIVFAGVPLGHEFESFVLALLQVSGRAPKIEDHQLERIKSIDRELAFETVVSLSCHNCPEVVQALNIMATVNPKISHRMVDGSMFQDYVDEKGVMAVPASFLNGESFYNGKINLNAILDKVTGKKERPSLKDKSLYDLLVIGGGPAGATAAIYGARKGIKTGLIAKNFGGQVEETLAIENITGFTYTEGPKFMASVKDHVLQYGVDLMDEVEVEKIHRDDVIKITTDSGELSAKTVVIATGAKWRLIGIPGEIEFRNKGVAYCTHCDGPLFKGKKVTVIGGGNSGIEAAIDLAGLAEEVLVLEFLPELKADSVLQDKLKTLSNVRVVTNAETKALEGGEKLEKIRYVDRINGEEHEEATDGCFIQVGLVPVTEWVETIEKNNRGEIIVDEVGATSMEGVFAAGDCTDSAFKQIVIAQGSGATAALGSYQYLMRQ